jgi:hypothetical protein
MQLIALGEALDGRDLMAVGLYGQEQTRARRLAVEQDRACAADAVLAAEMGASQPQVVTQDIGEMATRLDVEAGRAAVDVEGYLGHAAALSLAC